MPSTVTDHHLPCGCVVAVGKYVVGYSRECSTARGLFRQLATARGAKNSDEQSRLSAELKGHHGLRPTHL